MTKLIYLHIPKSGGTSQRTLLFDLYGRKSVFWHGSEQKKLIPEVSVYEERIFKDFKVVGGHQPLNYYPKSLGALYVSVVREPISRVISLFSYYTKPEFADDYHEVARAEALINWKKLGIDPDSLLKSINNCDRFREEILNYQCRYLSRYESTLEGVIRSFKESDIIIGESGSTAEMNTFLSDLLDWGEVPYRQLNKSKERTHEIILQEAGLEEAISEMVQEDLRLYNFIKEEHGGLYSNLSPGAKLTSGLRPPNPFVKQQQLPSPWKQVQVFTKGYIGIREDGTGSTGIIVVNDSSITISKELFPNLAIYYTLHGINGELLGDELFSRPLEMTIPAKGNLAWNLDVTIPAEFLEDVIRIHVGLLVKPSDKAVDHNPLHLASAHIMRV